ncbi:hypothetical protein IJ541_04185 [bacterium]|nr:hypothetical protein [bacterium]
MNRDKICNIIKFFTFRNDMMLNYSAPIGEVARSAVGELSFCHPEFILGSKNRFFASTQNDVLRKSCPLSRPSGTLFRRARVAFTLAEVLIILGIIGVVAAITIPSLANNIRAHQFRQKLKKTISTLSNAARMSEAQYGFDFAGINAKCGTDGGSEKPESVQTICSLLNGTLTGATYYDKASDIQMNKRGEVYTYTVSTEFTAHVTSMENLNDVKVYLLQDGTIIALSRSIGISNCSLTPGEILADPGSPVILNGCIGFIDVNGVNLPNKEVSCSTGENSLKKNTCIVKNDTEHMTDIYPIRFHDGVVEPATAAARYVLKTAK